MQKLGFPGEHLGCFMGELPVDNLNTSAVFGRTWFKVAKAQINLLCQKVRNIS